MKVMCGAPTLRSRRLIMTEHGIPYQARALGERSAHTSRGSNDPPGRTRRSFTGRRGTGDQTNSGHVVRAMRRARVALKSLVAFGQQDWPLESEVTRKRSRFVCAVRRFEIFLFQTGGTREMFLSYQLTRWRKPNGTRACWGSGACPKAL